MSYTVEVAGKTDVGCVRKNNEDNFGYDARYGIYIVCDGMGGQAAGEVASKMGVDSVLDYFRNHSKRRAKPQRNFDGVSERANSLGDAILRANDVVYRASHEGKSEQRGMGTTIVSVLLDGNFVSIGHVGDSRIYLIREDESEQLTNDHSLVMEQVRRGFMTLAEAEKSEIQNIILRALGSEENVEPDLADLIAQPGDTFLLACDGLTKMVKNPRMLEIVRSAPNLGAACDELIAAAKKAGGDDNITCILLRVVQESWWQKWFAPRRPNPLWQDSQ